MIYSVWDILPYLPTCQIPYFPIITSLKGHSLWEISLTLPCSPQHIWGPLCSSTVLTLTFVTRLGQKTCMCACRVFSVSACSLLPPPSHIPTRGGYCKAGMEVQRLASLKEGFVWTPVEWDVFLPQTCCVSAEKGEEANWKEKKPPHLSPTLPSSTWTTLSFSGSEESKKHVLHFTCIVIAEQ